MCTSGARSDRDAQAMADAPARPRSRWLSHQSPRVASEGPSLSMGLCAASQLASQRAANVRSLIQSANLNKYDPYVYLKDVVERLPTQPASRFSTLQSHRWQSSLLDD
jgi:hypothetical protein